MALKDNLKRLRNKANLSQENLEEITGIHKNQISKLERGEQSNPTLDTIIKLTVALRCSLDELVYDETKNGPDEEFKWIFEQLRQASPKRRETVKDILKSILLAETHDKINKM